MFIFRCSDRKIKDLLRLMKGFIVVENFYEYARCKEKLLKEYKELKEVRLCASRKI